MTIRPLRIPVLALLLSATSLSAADWPMWRHDAGRTATSSDPVPELQKLTPLWSRQLPAPAPAYRDARLQFDAGYEPIVVGKRLFVASNREDSVTAFDTDTGIEQWKFFTDGPVRFAPVADGDRVIFGSDDGCVYCVKADDGSLIWKHRAVPSRRLVLGNDRLISVWPVRGGPVFHDGRVYFAAGVWPLEGTFVFCLDATSGEVIWRNDKASYLYDFHPHNAESYGGLAPQGYLLVDGETGDLVVPSSQAYPARFDLQTGELKEFELPSAGRLPGGWFASTPAAKEAQKLKRRGLLFDDQVNAKPHEDKPRSEGLPEIRSTLRAGDREIRFEDAFAGIAEGDAVHSVIAADGKLIVTTLSGNLVALGQTEGDTRTVSSPVMLKRKLLAAKAPDQLPPTDALPQDGYALMLGAADLGTIEFLLSKTQLQWVNIDADEKRIATLRALGWDERPMHFIDADPVKLELPPYLAGAIYLNESLSPDADQLKRYYESLRPFGGKIVSRISGLASLAESAKLARASIETDANGWTTITRTGQLEGAADYTGDWTANSDQRVKAPLGLLWFGDSITHFKRSPQPKFINGVMISNPKDWTDASTRKGAVDYRLLETVFTDAYTGRILTKSEAPELRQSYGPVDLETIQPSQYRPPTQKNDWKPDAPRAGERINPLTGETEPRTFPKSYGCDGGVDYGNLYSMRSGTPSFYDKQNDSGTINISGPRSGCTNSIIPANGILNLPYFYEGCTCSYPLPVALALVSKPETFEQWASWGEVETEKLAGKIQRLGLNFGAPGDRKTDDGTLWLDVPNVGGPSPDIQISTEPALAQLETFYQHSLFLKEGNGWPWIGGSGVVGLKSVSIAGIKPGNYQIRITTTSDQDRSSFTTGADTMIKVGGSGILTIETGTAAGPVCGIEIIRQGS